MRVSELIEKLQSFPPEMNVTWYSCEWCRSFEYPKEAIGPFAIEDGTLSLGSLY